jgi:hypothetical protein
VRPGRATARPNAAHNFFIPDPEGFMKRFLCLTLAALLLAASAGAAAAQNRLAEGEPPLTRAMVDDVAGFFGWLFETRLSPDERGELERLLVEVWRRGDREDIKSVVEFGTLNDKLAAATDEQRRQVRAEILPQVLRSLRAEPDDFSRLMLSVHDAARQGRDAAPEDDAASGGDAAGLLGSWRTSQMSMLMYQNRATGSTTPGNGTTMQYRFHLDGRFEYNGYLQTTMYNCTTTLFNPMAGTYRVAGSRLTLTPRANNWQMRNNCAQSQNKDRPGKLDAVTYAFRTKQENGREFLCLTGADGKEGCYQRERE